MRQIIDIRAWVIVIAFGLSILPARSQAPSCPNFRHYADRVRDTVIPLKAQLTFNSKLEIASLEGHYKVPYGCICQISYSGESENLFHQVGGDRLLTIRFRESEHVFHNLVLRVPPGMAKTSIEQLTRRTGIYPGAFNRAIACSSIN